MSLALVVVKPILLIFTAVNGTVVIFCLLVLILNSDLKREMHTNNVNHAMRGRGNIHIKMPPLLRNTSCGWLKGLDRSWLTGYVARMRYHTGSERIISESAMSTGPK